MADKFEEAYARMQRRAQAEVAEAERIDEVMQRGMVTESIHPDQFTVAPARGTYSTFVPRKLVITEAGNVRLHREGDGRKGLQMSDAFDVALVYAQRAKRPAPFTRGQINVGRDYAALYERCAGSGCKLSSFEGGGGGGSGLSVTDAQLRDLRRLRWFHDKIGRGVAMSVRRVRPTKRGTNRPKAIRDDEIVHLFCVAGRPLSAILKAHGWSDGTKNKKALLAALCDALDRMQGFSNGAAQNVD